MLQQEENLFTIHSFITQQIIIFPFVIADNNRQHVCFCYETQQYIDMFANVKPLVYCLFSKINCSTSLLCLVRQSLFCTDTFLGCCTICEDRQRLDLNSLSPQQNLYIFLTLYNYVFALRIHNKQALVLSLWFVSLRLFLNRSSVDILWFLEEDPYFCNVHPTT